MSSSKNELIKASFVAKEVALFPFPLVPGDPFARGTVPFVLSESSGE